MRYQIGDLVTKKSEHDFGIVIKVSKANSVSLLLSAHSRQHAKNSQDIYYVFFRESGFRGPYYTSELNLKQSTDGTSFFR